VRGGDNRTGELFSYVDLEERVRRDHPLQAIRTIVNEALSALQREFAALYSPIGRPSIPPEKLLRAMLLQAFYSIRSERLLMERLEYDLLFRWFVGIIEGSNRSRVTDLDANAARDLFEAGLNEAASGGL
jgi:transposase